VRVQLIIVICIVVISRIIVEANVNGRVHAEYMRRRSQHGQSAFNILREPPAGVHSEYRRRWIRDQLADKTHQELPAREHTRQSTSSIRHHLRQQHS
jgi:hypothetical protein